jgi:ABC-type multidrug transport system fused ATPase/permease subunit
MFNEFFNGIKQITVFGAKEGWLARFDEANKLFARLYIRDYVWLSMPTNAIEVLGVSTILAIVLAMRAHLGGDMVALIPLAGVFAMALLKSLPALGTIAKARMEILGALPDAEAVIALLERKPKTARQGGREFLGFKKSLVFDNVSFMHDISKPLLSGINLSIGKNTVTAIVGASGAGKTTLINLILGLFAPSSGKILIDGMDLAEYDIESFRRKIGFVSQEPFIFHSTIYENITFEENIYTKDGVMEAARLANIHDFIISLKDGYKTVAGERGMKLSGGEQQRIAIARAVIRRPDILILDEATSALDSVSEKEVQKAINNVSKMCTVIVIAHRLSTVKGADKISVLKDGRIVEEGSHERLMEGNGYYRMLYEHQAL